MLPQDHHSDFSKRLIGRRKHLASKTSCRTSPCRPEEGDGEGRQRGDSVKGVTEGEGLDTGKGGPRSDIIESDVIEICLSEFQIKKKNCKTKEKMVKLLQLIVEN